MVHMPIIPALWKDEIGGSQVQSQPGWLSDLLRLSQKIKGLRSAKALGSVYSAMKQRDESCDIICYSTYQGKELKVGMTAAALCEESDEPLHKDQSSAATPSHCRLLTWVWSSLQVAFSIPSLRCGRQNLIYCIKLANLCFSQPHQPQAWEAWVWFFQSLCYVKTPWRFSTLLPHWICRQP